MKRLISTLNLSKEDWLRYRKCGITGTDAGAILGVNPYRSAFQVYCDKNSETIENIDNEAMRQGRDLEDYAYYEKPPVLSISLRKERKIMIDKQQDFLTLTGVARRARSEGYDITYHSLRNLVAAGYISHVPNGSRIYVFYPNVIRFLQKGLTAEQSLDYQLSRARN